MDQAVYPITQSLQMTDYVVYSAWESYAHDLLDLAERGEIRAASLDPATTPFGSTDISPDHPWSEDLVKSVQHLYIIQLLHDYGADPNAATTAHMETPLMFAAW